jgi:pteridine reductase
MKGTVLITGGARRIGKAVAMALAEDGFRIALHYRSSKSEAQAIAEKINSSGGACELFCANLNESARVRSLIPEVFNQCPDCRILINNASMFRKSPFMDTSEIIFDQLFQIHLRAPFFLTQAFASHCKEGLVINMLDAKAVQNMTRHFTYGLSKKSLFAFTEMAAKTLGPKIRVNGIAPGIILPSSESTEQDLKRMSEKVPLKRKGEIKDVVSAVLFFINNPYLTGQILYVDGGEHLL